MGVVYKAEDLKLGRAVALKFLAPDVSLSQEHRARFAQEARVLAAIDHPNICPVYEIDEAQGRLFLAMAFVGGLTLKETIGEGPLALDEAVRITAEAARGIQAAHRAGVIHRDIKSANIMLDSEGRVVVTDFGLARLEDHPGMTQDGMLLGTPDYMSPEQFRGMKPDRRSDIWSLGVVLYEAVSGKLPFRAGENPASVMTEDPEPLTTACPGAPRELDRIVRKALAKAPADRYQSAGALASDLQRLLGQLLPAQDRPRHAWLSSRSRRVTALAALALAIAFAGALLWRRQPPAPAHPSDTSRISIALFPLAKSPDGPSLQPFTDGLADAIIRSLTEAGGLRVISRSSATAYAKRTDRLGAIARDLQVDYVAEGSVSSAGGRGRVSLELIEAGSARQVWAKNYEGDLREALQWQSHIAGDVTAEVRAQLAHETCQKGFQHTAGGQRSEAVKGREYFQRAIAVDPSYAQSYVGMADTYVSEAFSGLTRPSEVIPKAEAWARQALRIDGVSAGAHRVLGIVQGTCRRSWPEAKREFDMALEQEPRSAWSHRAYAAYYLAPLGRLEEALRQMSTALETAPYSAQIAATAGWTHVYRRDYDSGATLFRRALELDPGLGEARAGLAIARALQGEFWETPAGPEVSYYFGWIRAREGKQDAARMILRQLIELSRRQYVSGYEIAQIHAALGEQDLALAQSERAFQEQQPQLSRLKIDPMLDPLHSHPRFTALVREMNLLE
jgi:serine/threonine-protein kinase